MQKVEEFMQELFRSRIAEEKKILAERVGYRQRFFAPDCRWDSRIFTLEMIESERIVSIGTSSSGVEVVTEYSASVSPRSARISRRRYDLRAAGDSWLICSVGLQCPHCHGQGDEECLGCKGKHWLAG
jgi:hypothetical protein